ncbi:MAG: 1-acyl-sn-glycerol-3-phosphate acyltransferase [Deltaproteobacteria bacterium]|nr:1-acyl-sn-glycerol-3-phosphate acyltransferase [Deltaproteobacteria bacterium]MCW8892538.1 1-acyl-sn-glycerol-3-phosphate acyltransferase [Deltaproteobacteria bacterium]MCW9049258.1 1-acyl-sn-glycerol-3-phosphate acyltransferase [Deltaproteobacteria bacterium]
MLRTLLFYFLFFLWSVIIILLALPLSLISADRIHSCAILWGRTCLLFAGLKLQVNGAENIPATGPAIYVSNHQSNFDIPILYAGLPIQFRWMAKQELFRVPFFGLAMKRCGYIAIDRSDRHKALHSLNLAAQKIKAGTSVVIFPEGTRTPDGKVQEFKKGALLIAAKAEVPVIPVAINGSYQVQPKGQWAVGSGPLTLTIFPPLATRNLKVSEVGQLTRKVHDQIAGTLEGETQHAV